MGARLPADLRLGLLLATTPRPPRGPLVTPAARRRRLVLYLFVVAAFVILAWRTEVQDRNLREAQWTACKTRVENVERTNRLYDGIVAIERRNPFYQTSPDTIRDRIDLYRAARLVPPDCGEKP